MIPTSFAESNRVLDKPQDMDREECEALSVWIGPTVKGDPVVVSCWKLTQADLETIQRTGRVWLLVFGAAMPPVALETENPFQEGGVDGEETG